MPTLRLPICIALLLSLGACSTTGSITDLFEGGGLVEAMSEGDKATPTKTAADEASSPTQNASEKAPATSDTGKSSSASVFENDGLGSVLFGDSGLSVTTENGTPVTVGVDEEDSDKAQQDATDDSSDIAPAAVPAPLAVPVAEAPAVVPEGGLETAWGVDVDQRRPLAPYGFSSPAVAGELVVVAGQDSYLHIFDLNGNEQRRVALSAASDSGVLTMTDHLVVLGDAQGILYGIDPVAGSVTWKWQMPSVMLGHPVRIGDDLLVQTGDNNVYRVSSANGEKQWSFSATQAGMSMNLSPSPLVRGDTCYALLSNGDAVALRGDNGDLVWRRQLLLNNDAVVLSELKTPMADPVLAGDVLITSFYQGDIIALSARDGQQLWQRKLSLKSSPLVLGGRVYAATAGGAVVELDPATGDTLWKRELGSGELVGPSLLGRSLVAADDAGEVYRLDLNGQVTGSLSLPGRVDRKPISTSGGVLLRNNLGGLYLIR